MLQQQLHVPDVHLRDEWGLVYTHVMVSFWNKYIAFCIARTFVSAPAVAIRFPLMSMLTEKMGPPAVIRYPVDVFLCVLGHAV